MLRIFGPSERFGLVSSFVDRARGFWSQMGTDPNFNAENCAIFIPIWMTSRKKIHDVKFI